MTSRDLDILYVITDLQVGGVPLHLCRLVDAMRRRGHGCAVVTLAPHGPLSESLRDEGVEVLSCEGRGGWDIRVIRRLTRIMRARPPRIVHSLLFHANIAARLAARGAGIRPDRVICEIQTVEVERRWHLLVDRLTHRGCRFTIGNSPSVIEHLATRARIPHDRLRLVRGGIDPALCRQAEPANRHTLPIHGDGPIVLWVGRLDPVKGLDQLVDAFKRIADASDAHLLLVGDGPMRLHLRRRIDRLGLERRIHLAGVRRDVPSLLELADVFAFPSRTEGLPNALLEAMAAGCPIVTTDVPGCRDLIEHDATGLIVPHGDTDRLARAILSLLDDRERAESLGRAAAHAVTNEWHIDDTFAAYAAAYDSIRADT